MMSMLGEEGLPMACEGDVMGAVTMYALYLANLLPAGYLDWNNSFGADRDMCIGIHCSNFPKSFIQAPFEIGSLDILGNTLGKERCFGACKATIAPGPMTLRKFLQTIRKERSRPMLVRDPLWMRPSIHQVAWRFAMCPVCRS